MSSIQGNPLLSIAMPPAPPASTSLAGKTDTSFKNLLLEGIDQVNTMQYEADQAVQQLLTGEDVDPASVLTSIQKADMSFRMMLQIRNKLVQAYQELKEVRI